MVASVTLVVTGAIALVSGCGSGGSGAEPSDVVQTNFAGLPAAKGEPTLPGLTSVHPHPGAVEQLAGPFDDRFELTDLRLSNGTVAGEFTITSDVSELLDLQVLAGFYNVKGEYLGSARFDQHTLHHDEGASHEAAFDREHHEAAQFSIEAPATFRDEVVSAAVGVPILVNE